MDRRTKMLENIGSGGCGMEGLPRIVRRPSSNPTNYLGETKRKGKTERSKIINKYKQTLMMTWKGGQRFNY